MTSNNIHRLEIGEAEAGVRLDKALAGKLPDLSRSRLKALIEEGRVTIRSAAGAAVKADPAYKVRLGDAIAVSVPPPAEAKVLAEAIPLTILYEDAHLLVVDKPAGLVVHPAAGNQEGTLVNALLAHCGASLSGVGGVKRPGIVHRLDKDTSGLLLVAKTDAAHARLSADFARHAVERAYLALVWGAPMPPEGDIEGAIGRSRANRKKMAVVTKGGKPALTHYRMLKRFGAAVSLVECRLRTGRTHQIRVHMASIGHTIIGDPTYGRSRSKRAGKLPPDAVLALYTFPRQALHARLIGFTHPVTGEPLKFESEPPPDMHALLKKLDQL